MSCIFWIFDEGSEVICILRLGQLRKGKWKGHHENFCGLE